MSNINLYPYQSKLSADIDDAWSRVQNVLAISSTGSGKTVVFSHKIAQHNGASCAIAHRQELVNQISMALARNGVRHRVLAGKDTIRDCVALQMRYLNRNFVDANARCAVAGVDTLIRMDANDPWFKSVGLWVMDECFVAGTLIDNKPIETIEVGDYVTAFNENDGSFSQQKVIRVFCKPQPKNMMRILTKTHHVLYCTQEHPFWTRRGWVNAVDLRFDDELYQLQQRNNRNKRSSTLSVSKDWTYFLLQKMRNVTSRRTSKTDRKEKQTAVAGHILRRVFKTGRFDRSSLSSIFENGACVLFDRLFKKISLRNIVKNNGEYEPEVCIGKNDFKKSNAKRNKSVKDVEHAESAKLQTECSRWKRKAADTSRINIIHAIQRTWFCKSTSDMHRDATWQWVSSIIQTRFGEFFSEISDRSRRSNSFGASIGDRCEERSNFEWVGLDSIEIYEPSDHDRIGNGNVYNIEVDKHHTYIANGIVVHNCHHTLRKNKWGKAVSMFPNAKGLGVTATGFRADGHGLGRHADGVFDEMIRAPGMRDIIRMGFLTEYRIFAPKSDIDLIHVPLSANGDYSPDPLRKAVHKSHVTGDIVDSYLKITPGAIGVTFCVDVESATEQAAAFRHKGVPAEVVSANTPSMVRSAILDRLGRGDIKQVTNVDLFGEGFDLPAIEVVSMGRPTHSQGLYDQQFGRAIRKKDGKPWGTIIDHVGNVLRHGVPDGKRIHTLDRREKRSSSSVTAQLMRVCPECTGAYERVFGMKCPYCEHVALPAARTGPEFVDGDLFELSPEALARLRGEIDKQPTYPLNAGAEIVGAINKRHRERNDVIEYLREAMMFWAAGKNDIPRAQREFYLTFGTDVMTAQTLNRADALKLMERIYATI